MVKSVELHHSKNIEAQIGEIVVTPNLNRNLLVLIKESVYEHIEIAGSSKMLNKIVKNLKKKKRLEMIFFSEN